MMEVPILTCYGSALKMGRTPDLANEKDKEGFNGR